ncbi:hypothetical protein ACFL3I_05380 [Pseudomonadota bacterium]
MRRLVLIGLITLLALVSTGAWGYTVRGAGGKSCGKYVSEKQEGSVLHSISLNWVLGFITGVNVTQEVAGRRANLGASFDTESIELWLENYCRANPLEDLVTATIDLSLELMKKE